MYICAHTFSEIWWLHIEQQTIEKSVLGFFQSVCLCVCVICWKFRAANFHVFPVVYQTFDIGTEKKILIYYVHVIWKADMKFLLSKCGTTNINCIVSFLCKTPKVINCGLINIIFSQTVLFRYFYCKDKVHVWITAGGSVFKASENTRTLKPTWYFISWRERAWVDSIVVWSL